MGTLVDPLSAFDAIIIRKWKVDEKNTELLPELLVLADSFDRAFFVWGRATGPLWQEAFKKVCTLAQKPKQWASIWARLTPGCKEERFVLEKIEELRSEFNGELGAFNLSIPENFKISSLPDLRRQLRT